MYCDYVYKASKDVDYVYQENSVLEDTSNEGPKETGNSGGTVEELDSSSHFVFISFPITDTNDS